MDLINTGSDSWILEFDACEKLFREVMEHLNARNSEKISSQTYDSLSAKIRIKLKQFSTEVSELNKKLNLANVVSSLTPEERERRKRQVETLQGKEVQLRDHFNQRKLFNSSDVLVSTSRAQLFGTKRNDQIFADMGTTSWGENKSNYNDECDTRTVEEVQNENERLLKEQNDGLETLLKIVTDQKQIASTINNEVEYQNEILVDIADGMERVDGRVNRATDMVQCVGKKQSLWGYWLIAFVLLIAIVGVACV